MAVTPKCGFTSIQIAAIRNPGESMIISPVVKSLPAKSNMAATISNRKKLNTMIDNIVCALLLKPVEVLGMI